MLDMVKAVEKASGKPVSFAVLVSNLNISASSKQQPRVVCRREAWLNSPQHWLCARSEFQVGK